MSAQIQIRYSQRSLLRFSVPTHVLCCFCCCLSLTSCIAVSPAEAEMQPCFLQFFWEITTFLLSWSWIFLLVSDTRSSGFLIWVFCLSRLAISFSISSLQTVSTAFYTGLCGCVQQIAQWPLQLLKKKYTKFPLLFFKLWAACITGRNKDFFSWGKSSSANPSLCSVPPY